MNGHVYKWRIFQEQKLEECSFLWLFFYKSNSPYDSSEFLEKSSKHCKIIHDGVHFWQNCSLLSCYYAQLCTPSCMIFKFLFGLLKNRWYRQTLWKSYTMEHIIEHNCRLESCNCAQNLLHREWLSTFSEISQEQIF